MQSEVYGSSQLNNGKNTHNDNAKTPEPRDVPSLKIPSKYIKEKQIPGQLNVLYAGRDSYSNFEAKFLQTTALKVDYPAALCIYVYTGAAFCNIN